MSPYNTGSSLELVAFFMLELLSVIYFSLKWLSKQNEQTKKSENGKAQGLELKSGYCPKKNFEIFSDSLGNYPRRQL